MNNLLMLFLLFISIATNIFASKVQSLDNNIKQNIDNLAINLKYLLPKYKENQEEIPNILKLYYQNYEKINAFEILVNEKIVFSSYKDELNIFTLENETLPINIKNSPEKYEKDIVSSTNLVLGKLVVYFKNEINFTDEELAYLKNKRVLKIQNDSNLTPYNFNENGIEKGYSIDYMNLIANKLALQIDYKTGIWDDFLNMLENEQLDLMINVLKSKQREERFLFSNIPYLLLTPSMISRIGERDYHSFSQLEGKTIALVKGYHSYDRVKKEYPNVKIFPTENTLDMIKAVSEKKADVAYGLKDVLEYNINKHLISNLKIANNIDDEKFGFYFAYTKGNTLLKSIIAKAEKLISKNEIEELNNKWFKKISQVEHVSKDFLFSPEEINYLEKKKSIKMCVDPSALPYEGISKDGKYIGMISDIINQLNKNTNINFELNVTSNWNESLNLVKDKKCDILPFTAQTISRDKYLNFTQPYLKFPTVIATKDNEFFINSLDEIKDKKIGIVKDYALIELIKYHYPNIKIEEVKDTKEGLEKVSNNSIYAFLGSLPTVSYNRQKYNILNVKISGKIPEDLLGRIAIRNDELILQNILNKAINSLKDDDTERIKNKWITIVKEKNFNTKLLIQIISTLVFIFILIVMFLIYRSNLKLTLLNKKLEKLSQTDKLTSLYNRTKLDSILENELKIKKRYKTDLCLVIADIDFFKNINDTYGHTVGDIILKEFSSILSKNIRETDYIGRWGGEEFLIILSHVKSNEAKSITENLRKKIEETTFYNNIHVTASFGIYDCKDEDPTKCLSKADKALYEAKEANRNCVKIYED